MLFPHSRNMFGVHLGIFNYSMLLNNSKTKGNFNSCLALCVHMCIIVYVCVGMDLRMEMGHLDHNTNRSIRGR